MKIINDIDSIPIIYEITYNIYMKLKIIKMLNYEILIKT